MRKHHLPILIALGGSVVVHLLLLGTSRQVRVHPERWAGGLTTPRQQEHVTLSLADEPAVQLQKDDDLPKPPEPPEDKTKPPEPERVPEPAPPALPAPKPPQVDKYPDKMGESTGKGIGSNAAEGLEPLHAREADEDQGFLSRDPRGGGQVGDPPSESVAPPGEGGHGGPPGIAMAVPAPRRRPGSRRPDYPAAAQPRADEGAATGAGGFAAGQAAGECRTGRAPDAEECVGHRFQEADRRRAVQANRCRAGDESVHRPGDDRQAGQAARSIAADSPVGASRCRPGWTVLPRRPANGATAAASPAQGRAAPVPVAPQAMVLAAPAQFTLSTTPPTPVKVAIASPSASDGLKPGPRVASADPAQQSDSESDAFAKVGSAKFRDGKLEVQFGRKIKTVRPKIPIVGEFDALSLGQPSVTLKVTIDPSGNVTSVDIAKSSGSNEIDLPCREAMYRWWFEPLKDKTGKAIPDCVLFTIGFR